MAAVTVKLSRGDNTPWGFRLQGGKDFGAPITIQRVNPNSLAEQGGLVPGDMILSINNNNVELLRHKEAQDCILRAGNVLEIRVERGGTRIWKPTVTPVGDMRPTSAPLTKTSLAANKQDFQPVGSSHNVQPKPFSSVPSVVNRQYNSPVNIYSMQSIAEALSAQTEVLASGATGINFMKEDKPINKGSAVYQMVHQTDDGAPHKDPVPPPGMKHVTAPLPMAPAPKPADPNQNLCADCGRLIVGVFVRIKDKNLHAECFKCSTCGTSLKNVGYYNVNEKLYCDIHAKQAASMMGAPAHMEPVIIPPGGNLPYNTPILSVGPTPPQGPSMASPKSPGIAPPFSNMSPKSPGTAPPFSSISPKSPGVAPPISNITPMPFHRPAGEIHHVAAPVSPQPLSSTGPPPFPRAPLFEPTPASGPPPTSIFASVPPQMAPLGLLAPAPATAPESTPAPVSAPVPAFTPSSNVECSIAPESVPQPLQSNGFHGDEHQDESGKAPVAPPMAPHPFGHPKTAPTSDAHKQLQGGSKFVWPPPKGPVSPQLATPTFESNASPSLPTYRPPPGTQHINQSAPPPAKVAPPPAPKPRPQSSGPQPTWSSPTPANAAPGGISPMSGSRPAPRRGRGQLKPQATPGTRIPICSDCGSPIRGPFIVALGKTWCPDHFLCKNNQCRRPLQDVGFVEEQGQLYCEICWEAYLAPTCCKCTARIKGDCLNALDRQWHPECFVCAYCRKPFGNSSFYLEDGQPYCEKDWNEMFTTKCVGCGFPIEAGDRWVEALNNNYHSQCFKCTICHKNLEGQSFYAKGGRPFCKAHAR